MTEQTRSLTAIMFTDIVGYTSLMEREETKAIQVREKHRMFVRMLVEQFQGTVVDTTGDELLATFPIRGRMREPGSGATLKIYRNRKVAGVRPKKIQIDLRSRIGRFASSQ